MIILYLIAFMLNFLKRVIFTGVVIGLLLNQMSDKSQDNDLGNSK